MDAQVNDKSLLDREGFTTNLATERFQSGMASQVSFECSHLGEGLLTHVTFEPE